MSAEPESVSLPLDLSRLSSLIDEKLEAFASGSEDIQAAALNATKFVFDLALRSEARSHPHISELLESISPSQAPQTRSQTRAAAQRERSPTPINNAILKPTPLSSLFVDGMDEDQIWAQLDLKAKNVCETLEDTFDATGDKGDMSFADSESMSDEDEELDGLDDMVETEGMSLDDEDGPWTMEDSDSEQEREMEEEGEEAGEGDLGEDVAELRDPTSDEDEDDDDDYMDLDRPSERGDAPRRKLKKGAHAELDDGFFDLAAFNAETEEAESRSVSRGRLSADSDDEGSDDEYTVDLFAPVDNVEAFEEEDEEADGGETFYKDFFQPPARAAPSKSKKKKETGTPEAKTSASKVRFNDQVLVKKIKPKGKGRPLSAMQLLDDDDDDDDEDGNFNELKSIIREELEEEDAEDMDDMDDDDSGEEEGRMDDPTEGGRQAIERLKDDLFAEDEAPQTGRSTHETRMASLKEQIASLEAENVGEKDWTLMGEATSKSRPQNALLEEDLEFERVMKTVPVVTEKVIHDLEERIKSRILESRYDDVVRRKPLDDKPFLPSRFFELQDKKSTLSLSQIYEDEFVAAQTGGPAGEDRDGKLKKEHQEIEQLWDGICSKLDALCNAHFTPKQPKATISTVSNISTIALESALPTSKSASTVLAPEEVFSAPASTLRARSELTPIEKRALRGKEKKVKKKQRQLLEKNVDKFARSSGVKGVKKQKEAALKSMVKTGKGVTVIGKKSQELKSKKRPTKS